MIHTFINSFEFGGEEYLAEALVRGDEEAIDLTIAPEPHCDLGEAIKLFLKDWLGEVVACHYELRRKVM